MTYLSTIPISVKLTAPKPHKEILVLPRLHTPCLHGKKQCNFCQEEVWRIPVGAYQKAYEQGVPTAIERYYLLKAWMERNQLITLQLRSE